MRRRHARRGRSRQPGHTRDGPTAQPAWRRGTSVPSSPRRDSRARRGNSRASPAISVAAAAGLGLGRLRWRSGLEARGVVSQPVRKSATRIGAAESETARLPEALTEMPCPPDVEETTVELRSRGLAASTTRNSRPVRRPRCAAPRQPAPTPKPRPSRWATAPRCGLTEAGAGGAHPDVGEDGRHGQPRRAARRRPGQLGARPHAAITRSRRSPASSSTTCVAWTPPGRRPDARRHHRLAPLPAAPQAATATGGKWLAQDSALRIASQPSWTTSSGRCPAPSADLRISSTLASGSSGT